MKDMITKLVFAIALIALLSWLQCRINAKRKNRSKQTLMPFLAVAYCIAALAYILYYYNQVVGFIDTLLNIGVRFIAGIAVVLNAVVFIAYIVYKIVGTIITAIVFRKIRIPKLTDFFYDYDEEYGLWFLKLRWVNLRDIFKWIVRVGAVLVGAVLWAMWQLGADSFAYSYIFPVFAQIILNEIYCFLNGYTKQEYETEILGDDSISQKISNYYKIREIYEKIFPKEILTSSTAADATRTQAPTDLLEEWQITGDTVQKLAATFFIQHESAVPYDTDSLLASEKLLRGQNVIFTNPFYRDLSRYVALPFINTLLTGKKCLVVIGRASTKDDIKEWLEELFYEYGRIRSLWRVKELSYQDPDCEVGLLTFSQLYDLRIHEVNADFFKDVEFVFMAEPSLILNTAQVAISIITRQMSHYGKEPTYCISDRMVGGLVDTMSHLLQQEFTEVVAAPVSRNIHTSIGWKADGDYLRQKLFGKQTQYLGNGIELAAVAIRNQIPEVSWYGETKVPVKDIKWIAGQYYPEICRYMNLKVQQQSIYDKIKFVSNIWSVPDNDEQFLIAEDEFVNVFNTMRTFLSRGRLQTFVNVLSEDYLMRDYMRYNTQMFAANPNAVPSLVPDYARTERNTLIKILLTMAFRPMREEEILREINLAGVDTVMPEDRFEQSKERDRLIDANRMPEDERGCLDALQELNRLLEKYIGVTDIFDITTVREAEDGAQITINHEFSITPNRFEKYFGKILKTAFYICEEEQNADEYLDAKLMGHVTQTVLPGQYVTYDGKYYSVKYVSPRNGVVLRRASKQFDGRKYYRQLRKYTFTTTEEEREIISNRTVMDVEIVQSLENFIVETSGYLEMNSNSDLRTAREVNLSQDPTIDNYTREYLKKQVIRIRLPECDDNIRFTFCLLMQELLRSVFPNAWQYISIVTRIPENVTGMLNKMLYKVDGEYDPECIYIVEDSMLDLGLLDTVSKNMMSFIEIITDFLYWHFEKLQERAVPDRDPSSVQVDLPEPDPEKETGRGLFGKIKGWFKRLKSRKGKSREEKKRLKEQRKREKAELKEKRKKEKAELREQKKREKAELKEQKRRRKKGGAADETAESSNVTDSALAPENAAVSAEQTQPETTGADRTERLSHAIDMAVTNKSSQSPSTEISEGPEDIFENTDVSADEEFLQGVFAQQGISDSELTDYQRDCFLKFGFDEIDSRLQLDAVRRYLTIRGFSNNALTLARKRENLSTSIIDSDAINHCDFCGLPITGVSYERLNDGRIRCNDCSASAINSLDEFKRLFSQTMRMTESFYGVEIKTPILVKTMDAKKIARGFGSVFTPSTDFTPRVVGYAQQKNGCYYLNVENGSPRLATIDTMVHELTHIWQYLNWDMNKLAEMYPNPEHIDIVMEGMAMWSAIQYLYLIGENSYAQQQEEQALMRDDCYGVGFRLYCEKYPLIKNSSLLKYSPFKVFPPL